MPASDLPFNLGRIRALTASYQAGGRQAFEAFHELTAFLLSNTILHGASSVARTSGSGAVMLGGWRSPTDPLLLRNGHCLRFSMTLVLAPGTQRLTVQLASYQYQLTPDNGTWLFRYDYLRDPPSREPAGHLQLRGDFREHGDPDARVPALQDVHFPTGRVSIEAVIRLLVEGFGVACPEWDEVWKPVLAESEAAFLKIAHPPSHG